MRFFGSRERTNRGGSGRNARARAVGGSLLAALAVAACASGRPELGLPDPRLSPGDPPAVAGEPLALPETHSASSIRGDIRFLGGGDSAVDLGPVVVYLVPRGRPGIASGGPEPGPIVATSRTDEFDPGLVAVARGQKLVLANEGRLTHGLFTAELGSTRFRLPPGTRTAPFTVPARGPVRFYCTLHSDETFVVFAAPAEHVAVIAGDDTYEFGPLAVGRYTLAVWSRFVEGPVRDVFANGFSSSVEPVWIDPALVGRRLQPEDRP